MGRKKRGKSGNRSGLPPDAGRRRLKAILKEAVELMRRSRAIRKRLQKVMDSMPREK